MNLKKEPKFGCSLGSNDHALEILERTTRELTDKLDTSIGLYCLSLFGKSQEYHQTEYRFLANSTIGTKQTVR